MSANGPRMRSHHFDSDDVEGQVSRGDVVFESKIKTIVASTDNTGLQSLLNRVNHFLYVAL